MATGDDFTFGHDHDDLLNRMNEEFGALSLQDDPALMVAGVLWLDQATGVRQDDDYVLITPSLGAFFLMSVTPTDSTIQQAFSGLQDEEAEDDDEADEAFGETFDKLVTAQPFEVEFTSPHGSEYTDAFPEFIRGKKIRVRIMNQTEAEQLSFVYTVRGNSDGTFVALPNSSAPASVKEANA